MEKDLANYIAYYLVIDIANKDDLGSIRNWKNIKTAFDSGKVWVTGFTIDQMESITVKSIPSKNLYYEKEGKLFFLHSLLPERAVPSLLWSPIDRALQVKLPSFNHNYFGVKEKIEIKLIPSEKVYEAVVMITAIDTLRSYIETAPAIRLQNLYWVVLDNDKVCILGKPLLPIKGDVYHKSGDFIIPAGYCFDLYLLEETVNKVVNPNQDHWIVWDRDTNYFKIPKKDMQSMSISSFRKTVNRFSSL